MECANCGFTNQAGMAFCTECGTPLAGRCPRCDFENPPRAKFCGACGQALSAAPSAAVRQEAAPRTAEPTPAAPIADAASPASDYASLIRPTDHPASGEIPPGEGPAQVAADRRQVTVVFCDLVGSTQLSERLDPEEWRDVLSAYHERCTRIILHYAGHIAQYLGDGVLAFFGYPVAHEDDASRALHAGLDIIQEVQQLAARLEHPLEVRIGAHTGLVVAGEVGRDPMNIAGTVPHVAARLQAAAAPGTLLVSADTHQLVRGLFVAEDLGARRLRGVSEPVETYRIVADTGARSPFEVALQTGLTPLTGREKEFGILWERWEQAQEGHGQVVLVSGEPGIGKSRLIQALAERVAAGSGATMIEYRCSPYYQSSAFYPLIDFLQRILNFKTDETPERKLEKLARGLAKQHFALDAVLPIFASLLSLPHPDGYPRLRGTPQQQKQTMHETLVTWFLQEAAKQPVHCVVEDLHWGDPSSLEFLSLLIEHTPRARLLLLLTHRPDFNAPWPLRSHMTQVMLNRLPRKHVAVMVQNVTKGRSLPAALVEQIAVKTDGVPLFVEELTKMVLESDGLHAADGRESDARAESGGPLAGLAIPTTLQDSLMARLDRLAPVRHIAQLAATLGREFSYELIEAVSPVPEAELRKGLAELVRAELLFQHGVLPNAHYTFKHALIRDAAYQSLLKSRRREYHEQIARTLAERFSDIRDIHPELLAHHFTQAELTEDALTYWHLAGRRAIGRSAGEEAIRHLQAGVALLDRLPDTPQRNRHELAFQTALGAPLMVARGYAAPEVEHAYRRALALCERVGGPTERFRVLRGYWAHVSVRGDLPRAERFGHQLLELADNADDPGFHAEARFAAGCTAFWQGAFTAARDHLERGAAKLGDVDAAAAYAFGQHPAVAYVSYRAWTTFVLGYFDQARVDPGPVKRARELGHPFTLASALFFEAVLAQLRDEADAAREHAGAVMHLAREQRFPYWLAMGTVLDGWAQAAQGETGEGMAQIRDGLQQFRACGAELASTYFLGLLADTSLRAAQQERESPEGWIDAGLGSVADALAAGERTGERVYTAELYRLQGEMLSRQTGNGDGRLPAETHDRAAACFRQAIAVAREQEAKYFELRAAMSFFRLCRTSATSEREAARRALAHVTAWFREGRDSGLLRAARDLLEPDDQRDQPVSIGQI